MTRKTGIVFTCCIFITFFGCVLYNYIDVSTTLFLETGYKSDTRNASESDPARSPAAARYFEARFGYALRTDHADHICTQDERRSYIRHQCRENDVSQMKNYSKLFYVKPNSQFLEDPKHQIIYCQVSKDGCSTWKSVLISALLGHRIRVISAARAHARNYLESLGIVYMKRWFPKHQHYTKFMVTRHPLDRLLSGYKNMIKPPRPVGPSYSYNNWINQQIYGNSPNVSNKEASFEDFLRLVSSKDWQIRSSIFYNDRHWLPISQVCQPCSISYDYIIRLETADHDAKPVLNLLKLQDEHLPKSNNIRHTEKLTATRIGQSFLQDYADISPEIMRNVYERYHLDFSLYGYTYDDFNQEVNCNIRGYNGSRCC